MVEEKSMLSHDQVEGLFAGVAEWRMANVMHQSQSFDKVHIQAELGSDRPRNLRDFQSMGQAITKMIRVSAGENLGLGF